MISKQELNMQLNELCEEAFQGADLKALQQDSEAVRACYRDKTACPGDLAVRGLGEAQAYLAWRFPVTALVIFEVLGRLKEAWPEFSPGSILDIGAGPAVSVLPVLAHFPGIRSYHLLEKQPAMQKAGELILDRLKGQLADEVEFHRLPADFKAKTLPQADLVLASYVVNELTTQDVALLCQRLTTSVRQAAVLIVPGTPEHFHKLTDLRNQLLASGFTILAPCTFSGRCHMEGETDWCHFYQRVQRSSLLRQLKGAELAYEDEKFSYLVVARTGQLPDNGEAARIIRHPLIQKGYRDVTLCSAQGVSQIRFTKGKHREVYRELKDLGWGDLLWLK